MSLVIEEKEKATSEKEIEFRCPTCQQRKHLCVPTKIFNQSSHITTVSIPAGLVCEHNFQAFIDPNFKIRGFQKIDYDLSRLEYYDDLEHAASLDTYKSKGNHKDPVIPQFKEIMNILRSYTDKKEILGSAILTEQGRVLYSSIPNELLYGTIKEFEARSEKNLVLIQKLFLLLENNQVISSEIVPINDEKLVIVLIFSESVKFGMANFFLADLIKKINNLTF